MHQRNKARSLFLVGLVWMLSTVLIAQNPPAQQPQAAPTQNQQVTPVPSQPPPQQPQVSTPPAQNQPAATQNPPANQQPTQAAPPADAAQPGEAPQEQQGDVYIFKKEVDEVTLHATVVDEHNRLVTDLTKGDFTVLEDGKPQKIVSFRREDVPVAMGIVIDNSGSMRDKRPKVNAAAINLVQASNPQDQVFVVNFNEEYFLDQDYTGSVPKLRDALERIESRGGTALYDATVASADHLKKSGALEKKVLLVVTDGEDNASRESLEEAVRRLEEQNGPTIYTIGILDEERSKRARRALRQMAEDTGGEAFFPKSLDEVQAITSQIAHDIRNQYTITYRPTRPQSAGGYRQVKVDAQAKGYKHLQVRTRSGYYAGENRNRAALVGPGPEH